MAPRNHSSTFARATFGFGLSGANFVIWAGNISGFAGNSGVMRAWLVR
jgi:hypothetical protein